MKHDYFEAVILNFNLLIFKLFHDDIVYQFVNINFNRGTRLKSFIHISHFMRKPHTYQLSWLGFIQTCIIFNMRSETLPCILYEEWDVVLCTIWGVRLCLVSSMRCETVLYPLWGVRLCLVYNMNTLQSVNPYWTWRTYMSIPG